MEKDINIYYFECLLLGIIFLISNGAFGQIKNKQNRFPTISNYDVVWHSPGKNSLGSMPAGNGDIGINSWAESDGDLTFYLSKIDAWGGDGRLLKLGKVRISIFPNPFKKGLPFLQILDLKDGIIHIKAGKKNKEVDINLWVDANHPVVDVNIRSKQPVKMTAQLVTWRNKKKLVTNPVYRGSFYGISDLPKIYVYPDSILHTKKNEIVWFHRNQHSIWKENLKLQVLDDWAKEHKDPLLNRTFGGAIRSHQMIKINSRTIRTKKPVNSAQIQVYALTRQTPNVNGWIAGLQNIIRKTSSITEQKRLIAHKKWWQRFWNRSYIYVTSFHDSAKKKVNSITSGYILQRYMNACGGRGKFPIKFNGSIFTVDTKSMKGRFKGLDADYRQWGGAYWWQNTRLIYWPMLMCGDFDLMHPFFNMYFKDLPIRKAATKLYYNQEGAFYPETIYFWGTYLGQNYGRNRKGKPPGWIANQYIKRYWQSGLEMSMIMLDYYAFTKDRQFAMDTLIPFASAILKFYDEHWPHKNGKLHFEPANSLETYWGTVLNPMAVVAGIKKVTDRMLQLNHSLTSAKERREWKKMLADLPPIPEGKNKEGKSILLPAAKFGKTHNFENPELYAVFPYRLYGVGKPNLKLAIRTFRDRKFKQTGGWQQNAIQASMLGLTNVAKKDVINNFNQTDKQFRFKAMWGLDYDWIPEEDNGAVAMQALQDMLMQYSGNKIYLLPAWPKDWNVKFKLHAPENTTVSCTVKRGKVTQLSVVPGWRRKDVIIENEMKSN